MRKKWWMCLSVAVFLGIMLIFCIMNDNKRIEESFSEQSKEERSNLKGTKIATIILLEDQTEKVMQAAMRNTARKYGAIVVEGQSGGELERETVLVNQYIEQGVDAFCIYPVSPTGSAAALEKVTEQGIAIYSVDLNMESEWQTGYCEANQYNIGQMVGIECANYIRKYFPDRKPKVAIIEFSALLPNTSADRTNGFLSATRNLIEVVQDHIHQLFCNIYSKHRNIQSRITNCHNCSHSPPFIRAKNIGRTGSCSARRKIYGKSVFVSDGTRI